MILDLPSRGPVLLDDADAAIIAPYRWYAAQQESGLIYARGEHYRGEPRVYMHRLLENATAAQIVDHADGDGLHNCRTGDGCMPGCKGNLRKTTHRWNNKNARKKERGKLYKGVYTGPAGRWFAELQADGRRYWDRGHTTEADAARAYDRLAKLHHGEFARLNFPPDGGPPAHIRALAILDAQHRSKAA